MEQIAAGVWRGGTRYVNWYAVDGGEGGGLTLIDAGLPGYAKRLDRDLATIGRSRGDVRAVVLTHGHVDHTGMAASLAASGTTVYLHDADTRLAADPRTNKTDAKTLPYLRYPAMLAFVVHLAGQGGFKPPPMPSTTPIDDGAALGVPGRPVATHAPGHTDGSVVLEFREHGVVFVGDLLCTTSPITGRREPPQLQTRGSNRNSDQAMQSLSRLEGIEARTVLPGHGSPWLDGVEAAAASARRIGCR